MQGLKRLKREMVRKWEGGRAYCLTVQLLCWNGIKATFSPGVALGDAAQGQKGAVERTAGLQGLKGIGRAAWVKTATASTSSAERMEQRGDQPPVEVNGNSEKEGHRVSPTDRVMSR